MSALKPWALGPFELIVHAEIHQRNGEDFDRRMSLISFDNSIEVSITTYLTLNPIQRNGAQYQRDDVSQWLKNYHTKLDFFFDELQRRTLPEIMEKSVIIWYHDHRNEQYHGGTRGVPESRALDEIRKAALWVFSVLFDVQETERILNEHIEQRLLDSGNWREKNPTLDRLIDAEHGVVDLAGRPYYTSETLFAIDPAAYREVGGELQGKDRASEDDDTETVE
ncbi:MAG: hypothetical protein JRJ85_06765 [Deltaproteobacteria bacterium]|nr:hypothetical protein [Deltaproteobacteria bacterium]